MVVSYDAPLPDRIVYYNQWTGFENLEIAKLFEMIPASEIPNLKRGDTVWIEHDPPSGRVYSYDRAQIVSVSQYPLGISVQYEGIYSKGSMGVWRENAIHEMYRCTDVAKLMELVSSTPLATEAGTVTTMNEESRSYLRKNGSRIFAVR